MTGTAPPLTPTPPLPKIKNQSVGRSVTYGPAAHRHRPTAGGKRQRAEDDRIRRSREIVKLADSGTARANRQWCARIGRAGSRVVTTRGDFISAVITIASAARACRE